MKVLLDHGAYNNLGDLAMLEAVIRRMHQIDNTIELYVRVCPLQSEIWSWQNVHRVSFEIPDPTYNVPYASRIPFVRRYEQSLGQIWLWSSHLMLGRILTPGKVSIWIDGGRTELDTWCRGFDVLHVAGGGDLNDVFTNEMWQRCCLIHAFAAQKKPVLLTGQQLGPFYHRVTERALQRALRNVQFIGLREPTESLRICTQAGLLPGSMAVMGDDSLDLPAADRETVDAILARRQFTTGEFLAVNIRIGSYAPLRDEHFKAIAGCVAHLSKRYDMPVLVVPISLDEGDSDVQSGYRLAEVLGGDMVQVLDEPDLSASLVKSVLGQAYAAIGISYHFCTFALSQGVPAVALFEGAYYAQKARGLSSFWGDERIAMPVTHLGAPEALQHIEAVFDDERLRSALTLKGEQALRTWQDIFDLHVQRASRKCANPVRV